MKEELSMKIKSIVLTAALATAFSAFSESVNVDWFTTNATSVASFDTAVGNPVVVTNDVNAPIATFSGYAVTAYVTNLVVFAEKPAANALKDGAKGAICAAYDSSEPVGNKWYGLSNAVEWVELSGSPSDNTAHALKMEFIKAGSKVRYVIDAGTPSNWFDTPAYDQPNLYAFAGMGFCTNIVGEVFIDVPAGFAGVEVEDANGIPVGRIIIDAEKLDEKDANNSGANGLKKWVNYVLGISNADAAAKPYAAPVQNNSSNTLTFKLGGVHALDQSTTGAKVTYTVEQLETPNAASGSSTKLNNIDNGYVGPNDPVSVDLPSSGVKYYRIKIKIDPAH